jgi:hypothetical protein
MNDEQPEAGVRLRVLGCGSCRAADRYPAYLSRMTPKYRELRAMPEDERHEAMRELSDDFVAQEIRAPEGGQWFSIDSSAGQKIVREARSDCRNHKADLCLPQHRLDHGGTDF